ncbi:hypothetical protein BH23DEI1_BH23DEI1_10330 [soil metagenome]|nr:cupin domain-containing protein [Trueperaceae bacterium]
MTTTPTTTTFHPTLLDLLPQTVEHGVPTQALFSAPGGKVSLFRFDAGKGMAEHTSTHAVTLHVIEGSLTVRVEEERYELDRGAFLAVPATLPHALEARTPALVLLTLLTS